MGVTEVRFLEPRRLNPGETLEGFSCGVELIDNWANRHAPYAAKRGTAVPYVCFTTSGKLRASMRLVRIQLIVMP